MQSKTFSQLSFLVAVIVTGFVIVYIAGKGAAVVPAPEFTGLPTSTPATVSATSPEAASAAPVQALVVPQSTPLISIKSPKGTLHVLTATTSAERELGLGGRTYLAPDSGMLFVFDEPGAYGFWMKDTLVPLDFVWVSQNKSVAGISSGIATDTYPQVYYPPTDIGYVLELNSGSAAKWGIATGTKLAF